MPPEEGFCSSYYSEFGTLFKHFVVVDPGTTTKLWSARAILVDGKVAEENGKVFLISGNNHWEVQAISPRLSHLMAKPGFFEFFSEKDNFKIVARLGQEPNTVMLESIKPEGENEHKEKVPEVKDVPKNPLPNP